MKKLEAFLNLVCSNIDIFYLLKLTLGLERQSSVLSPCLVVQLGPTDSQVTQLVLGPARCDPEQRARSKSQA